MVHALVDLLHVPLAGRVLTNRSTAATTNVVVVISIIGMISIIGISFIHIRCGLRTGLRRRVRRFLIDWIQLLERIDRVATLLEIALLGDQIGRIRGHKTIDVRYLRDRGLEGGSKQKYDRQSALGSTRPIQRALPSKTGHSRPLPIRSVR